jgi:hypothetical protein
MLILQRVGKGQHKIPTSKCIFKEKDLENKDMIHPV